MTTFLFDIDHTLYPYSEGVEDWFSQVIDRIIIEEIGVGKTEARAMRTQYYHQFGSTLTGLMYYHEIDVPTFFRKKGGVPLNVVLRDDKAMRAFHNLDREKRALTNASSRHGQRVVKYLGIIDQFESLHGINDLGYWGKPFAKTYNRYLEMTGLDPNQIVFFEDSARNLRYPKTIGMTTVLVGTHDYSIGDAPDFVDYHTANLADALEKTHDL